MSESKSTGLVSAGVGELGHVWQVCIMLLIHVHPLSCLTYFALFVTSTITYFL